MKKLLIVSLMLMVGISFGCARTIETVGDFGIASLEQTSQTMDGYVEILSRDWPKASAAIREGIGTENLPKNISDQMDRIDKIFKDDNDNWLTTEQRVSLSDYDKWSAAFARLRHMGPVMKAIVEQQAPGLLLIPEVARVFMFMGFGGL